MCGLGGLGAREAIVGVVAGVTSPRATLRPCLVDSSGRGARRRRRDAELPGLPVTISLLATRQSLGLTPHRPGPAGGLAERWPTRYPAVAQLWRTHAAEWLSVPAFRPAVRPVIQTTKRSWAVRNTPGGRRPTVRVPSWRPRRALQALTVHVDPATGPMINVSGHLHSEGPSSVGPFGARPGAGWCR